jgi:hypothetical protein
MKAKAKATGPHADFCFGRVTDIEPSWLARRGIRGILLDIDNTITLWGQHTMAPEELEWIRRLHAAKLKCRLLSNRPWQHRHRVAELTSIAHVDMRSFKPSAEIFRQGMREMGLEPRQVMMIGDIVFTDILPANRLGMWTTLVEPLGGKDFLGTKVWRLMEMVFRWRRPLDAAHDYRNKCPGDNTSLEHSGSLD